MARWRGNQEAGAEIHGSGEENAVPLRRKTDGLPKDVSQTLPMKRNQGWLIRTLRDTASIVMNPCPVFRPESCLLKESVGPHEDGPSVTAARIDSHESPSRLPKGPMAIQLR